MKTKILLALMGLILFSGCLETGGGSATDTVQTIEYSGLLCKTWKVWFSHDIQSSEHSAIWSVRPEDADYVIPVLQEAREKNLPVKVDYITSVYESGCLGGAHSGYAIIIKAELVK